MDFLNSKAVELLTYLGNHSPSKENVFLAERLIYLVCGNYKIKIEQLDITFSCNTNPVIDFLNECVEQYRWKILKLSENVKNEYLILERKENLPYQRNASGSFKEQSL